MEGMRVHKDKTANISPKPSKKKQRKLAFKNIPREPSSGPMEAVQGIDDSTAMVNRNSKMVTAMLVPEVESTLAVLMEGTEGMSKKDSWNKVKPSKKKQRKLAFENVPSIASSKSGPMEVDPTQGIDDHCTSTGNKSTKTATIVTPPPGLKKKRKS